MAYYLGRDVKVWILSEDPNQGVKVTSNAAKLEGNANATNFAQPIATASAADTYALTDLTGVDVGIGVTDEDVSYIGLRTVLKAEIKKETTLSLTRKKSDNQWDVIFNGPITSGECSDGTAYEATGARWGLDNDKISAGLTSPSDHKDGSSVQTFGYRLIVQLADATESICIPGCQVTGHSVTLNADGTTEETMEFLSNVDPIIVADSTTGSGATAAVAAMSASDL